MTQAIAMERMFRRRGHEVAAILLGKSSGRNVPEFFLRQTTAKVLPFDSPEFSHGGADRRPGILKSILHNIPMTGKYLRSIVMIRRILDELRPDAVINFYEPLAGLAYLVYRFDIPHVCIGHQYLFLHRDFEFPETASSVLGGLKFFTRLTSCRASVRLALSFRPVADDSREKIKVVPPLLRKEILDAVPSDGDYILGYMVNPGFVGDVLEWHRRNADVPLRFFRDGVSSACEEVDSSLSYFRIDDAEFIRQMAGCRAYATTAGFESVCEAMYLGKPVLMVPAYVEQECNAFDAVKTGMGVISDRFDIELLRNFRPAANSGVFSEWVDSSEKTVLDAIESFCAASSASTAS